MTYEEFKKLQHKVENRNLLTEEELNTLKPYKVDNAIIMAAGYSARCMPLSNILPKGLFRVKGEILIEREIRQLQEAGIKEIIVVTGFMQEKFQYLREKYGVILIHNDDYDKYNNIASLYKAQNYMKILIFYVLIITMQIMYFISMSIHHIIHVCIQKNTAMSIAY